MAFEIGQEVQEWVYTGHTRTVNSVAVDSDGNVYSASSDNELHKVDSNGNNVWTYTGHTDNVYGVAVDNNGNVYSASSDNEVHKINSQGNQEWAYTGHTETVRGVAVDNNGNVYSASLDNEVHKINSQGNQEWAYTGHTDWVYGVAVDNNGNVYSGSLDNELHKINPDGTQEWVYKGHTDRVYGVAVDSDGNVYSGSWDNEVHKINSQGNQEWAYTGHTDWVYDVAVDSDGNVYSGSWDNELHKINPDGTQEWVYTGHTETVSGVAVDNNGNVYSASSDNELHKIAATSDFSVTITGGDSFVLEDSVLNIDYSVENVGGVSGTQNVGLTTTVQGSGTVVDSDTVSLDPGQTKTGTLSYDLTGEPVEPEETATVSTEDSSSSGLFYVAQHRFLETVDQLEDGQEYEFRAAAEDDFGIDTGSIKTTTTVERQNGTVSTVESVSGDISQRQLDLEGTIDTVGDYAEVGFDAFFKYREQGASTWNETSRTGFTSTGVLQETVTGLTEETTYEYKFVADFGGQEVDGTTYTATTLAPIFDFTIDNMNDFLKEGRTLSIDYTVENTGTVESTQDLSLAFDTDTNVVDSAASVTVGSGATSSGTFTFDTTGQTEGVYDIYLFGAEGVSQSSVEILVNSLIEFLAPAANEIVADRSPEIEYRLDIEGSGTVEVRFDGETVDTLNAPFDNVTQVSSLSDLDRDNQSKNWNIVYTGGQTDRDVTRSFVTGFVLKETDPEAI